MELSQFTDYALRLLIYAGLRTGPQDLETVVSVREISTAYGISRHHLVKVAQRLSQLGYIRAHRGRGGGIALDRSPESINIGAVVRQTENLSIVECFGSQHTCCLAPVCELKRVLGMAREAFLKSLDQRTLADLLVNKSALLAALPESSTLVPQ